MVGYSKCPSLDTKTGFIDDADQFCKLLENKQDFDNEYNGIEDGTHLNLQFNRYKVYSFVAKDVINQAFL